MKKGTLYLIPTFLAETNDLDHFPPINQEITNKLKHFIVENLRTARRFLRKTKFTTPFDEVVFYELNKHTNQTEKTIYLKAAEDGIDMGLLSEAGLPCVADPGAEIVSLSHQLGINVVPLTGPSSIFLALMASGFNGQNFSFHGYLPIDKKQRERSLKDLERSAIQNKQTQMFIETPYRNNHMLDSILKTCNENMQICVATMLTHNAMEFIKTKTAREWKKNIPDLHKKPTVFLMYP